MIFSTLLCCYLALIGEKQLLLFIDDSKIPVKLASEFDRLGIVILPYDEASEIVSSVTEGSSVLINPATDIGRSL